MNKRRRYLAKRQHATRKDTRDYRNAMKGQIIHTARSRGLQVYTPEDIAHLKKVLLPS